MTMWCPPPSYAGWRSGCATSNDCLAARPWRTRSSRRRSTWRGQKKRSCCRALRCRMVPDEAGHRYARPGSLQTREGDLELVAEIRRLVDARPTYGYRRIAALLKRERRSDGLATVNAKRVYRLMKKHGLLLERYTGRRRPREHDGQVATIRSNCRWCSDALEFTCWNGEIVRIAFALDCHDREVISWVATTAGISGE